jgi:hypothetical protein
VLAVGLSCPSVGGDGYRTDSALLRNYKVRLTRTAPCELLRLQGGRVALRRRCISGRDRNVVRILFDTGQRRSGGRLLCFDWGNYRPTSAIMWEASRAIRDRCLRVPYLSVSGIEYRLRDAREQSALRSEVLGLSDRSELQTGFEAECNNYPRSSLISFRPSADTAAET